MRQIGFRQLIVINDETRCLVQFVVTIFRVHLNNKSLAVTEKKRQPLRLFVLCSSEIFCLVSNARFPVGQIS